MIEQRYSQVRSHGGNAAGYSLIEVLVAAGVVAIGIGAAAVLAMSMVSQQEGSARVVRALNYQEQACRLFQLGVSPTEITNILPRETAVTSLTFTVSSPTIANVGDVQMGVCQAVISTESRFSSGGSRTNTVAVIRPSTR